MNEPILVVDPGSAWTTAALVTAGEYQPLKEPSSGSYYWPTSVALDGQVLRAGTLAERRKRADPQRYAGQLTARLQAGTPVALGPGRFAPHELMAALLGVLRAEAQRLASAPVDRVLVLVPDASGPVAPAGQAMLAAAGAAGFGDAELLFLPAALALAAAEKPAAGSFVLVCDAGASALRVTLLQVQEGGPALLRGHSAAPACGGNQLDALLAGAVERKNGKWMRPLLTAEGAAGERARLDLEALVRLLRHQVSEADRTEQTLTPLTPAVQLGRQDLERWMKGPLAQVAAACREVLSGSSAPAGIAAAPRPARAAAATVILAGGCARTPAIQRALAAALSRPVTPAPVPELAALHGGIEWAISAASRRIAALPVPVGTHELSWDIPGGAGRLIGWRVPPGTSYGPGQALATIRSEDDAIWELTDDRPGVLAQHYPAPGSIVATGDVLAVTRATTVTSADLRGRPLQHSVLPGGRFATFSPDGGQLATLDATGTLRIWDIETTVELNRFAVRAPLRPKGLDAAVTADGHWLAGFFDGAAVTVWDVTAGKHVARLSKGKDPQTVQFSADGRRLGIAEPKRARIWDTSGQDLLSVKDRLHGSGAVAMSQDGGRLALVAPAGVELWDQAAHRCTLVRALPRFKGTVRCLAFATDGARILFTHDSAMELVALPSGTVQWAMELPNPVADAAFAPGDRLLATIGPAPGAASVTLWDPATGAVVGQLGPADRPQTSVRFSADGRFVVSTAEDTALVWALAR